jgi:hypothetical protein
LEIVWLPKAEESSQSFTESVDLSSRHNQTTQRYSLLSVLKSQAEKRRSLSACSFEKRNAFQRSESNPAGRLQAMGMSLRI